MENKVQAPGQGGSWRGAGGLESWARGGALVLSAPVRWQKGDLCGYLRVRILRGHIDYITPETVQEGTEGKGLQWGSSAYIYTVYSLMTWMTGGS